MTNLDDALERSREMIEEALVGARSELETVEARRRELLDQIAQAEAILGGGPPTPPAGAPSAAPEGGPLTLHEALARVLEDAGNEGMSARELADAVNRRGLYRKRNGSPVEVNQVHARINNYGNLFEKDGSKIRLKEGTRVLATDTPNLVMFKDDDDAFFEWQDAHTEGEFINTERKPNPNYLVLHKSGCPHFKGSDSVHWTKDYVKIASTDHSALETWARGTVGGEITLCGTCFGH
jgi:HB1, ASXL, restriction endonuclease HTH domain